MNGRRGRVGQGRPGTTQQADRDRLLPPRGSAFDRVDARTNDPEGVVDGQAADHFHGQPGLAQLGCRHQTALAAGQAEGQLPAITVRRSYTAIVYEISGQKSMVACRASVMIGDDTPAKMVKATLIARTNPT